jgi:putative DNA primase/helicase
MYIYRYFNTKSTGLGNDELHNAAITLHDLSDQKIWVAWKEQPNKQGKLTKIPKDPTTGDNAKVPTDPNTYGTLDDAITCSKAMPGKGGVGVVLGAIGNGCHLVGIDLDSCHDPNTETIAEWAEKVIDRFDTYAEISPS